MSTTDAVHPLQRKVVLAVLLVLCGLALFLADRMMPAEERRTDDHSLEVLSRRVGVVLDTMYARYGIDRRRVRTWQVQVRDGKFARIEQRVLVPPSFISLDFNHDLNRMVADVGARVSATERTKENIVNMHIMKDGTTFRSVEFVVTPEK